MDNEKAEDRIPNKMSHSQIQSPDTSKLYDWNPLTEAEASIPQKEGLYNMTIGVDDSDSPSAFLKKLMTIYLATMCWERGIGILVLGQNVSINTNNTGPRMSWWCLC